FASGVGSGGVGTSGCGCCCACGSGGFGASRGGGCGATGGGAGGLSGGTGTVLRLWRSASVTSDTLIPLSSPVGSPRWRGSLVIAPMKNEAWNTAAHASAIQKLRSRVFDD